MRTLEKIPTLNALAKQILKKLTDHGYPASKNGVMKYLKDRKLKWCTGGYKRSSADKPFKGDDHGIYWYEWRRDKYESYIRIYTINDYYKFEAAYQALIKAVTPPPSEEEKDKTK